MHAVECPAHTKACPIRNTFRNVFFFSFQNLTLVAHYKGAQSLFYSLCLKHLQVKEYWLCSPKLILLRSLMKFLYVDDSLMCNFLHLSVLVFAFSAFSTA